MEAIRTLQILWQTGTYWARLAIRTAISIAILWPTVTGIAAHWGVDAVCFAAMLPVVGLVILGMTFPLTMTSPMITAVGRTAYKWLSGLIGLELFLAILIAVPLYFGLQLNITGGLGGLFVLLGTATAFLMMSGEAGKIRLAKGLVVIQVVLMMVGFAGGPKATTRMVGDYFQTRQAAAAQNSQPPTLRCDDKFLQLEAGTKKFTVPANNEWTETLVLASKQKFNLYRSGELDEEIEHGNGSRQHLMDVLPTQDTPLGNGVTGFRFRNPGPEAVTVTVEQ